MIYFVFTIVIRLIEFYSDNFLRIILYVVKLCICKTLVYMSSETSGYICESIQCLRIYPAREICRVQENRVVDRIARRKIGMNGTKNVAGHAWRIVGVLGMIET